MNKRFGHESICFTHPVAAVLDLTAHYVERIVLSKK